MNHKHILIYVQSQKWKNDKIKCTTFIQIDAVCFSEIVIFQQKVRMEEREEWVYFGLIKTQLREEIRVYDFQPTF